MAQGMHSVPLRLDKQVPFVCFCSYCVVLCLQASALIELLTRLVHLQGVREIEEWMSHSSGLSLDELRPHMFLLRDRDATGHLLK